MAINAAKVALIFLSCAGVAQCVHFYPHFSEEQTVLRVKRSANGTNATEDTCEFPDSQEIEKQSDIRRRKRNVSETQDPASFYNGLDNDAVVNHNTTSPPTCTEEFFPQFSDEFLSCVHLSVVKGCYEVLLNRSVLVPVYSLLLNDSNYCLSGDVLRICPNFFNDQNSEAKYGYASIIITNIGTGISAIFLVLYLCVFVLVKALRNLPGSCICCLCLSLLLSYIFLFLPGSHKTHSQCRAIGICLFYFFLTSFFWMNIVSYDVWRSLRMATAKLRLTGSKVIWTRFAVYSFYAWGSPLIWVISGIAVSSDESVSDSYRLIFNQRSCWFEHKQALLVYFAIPLFVILVLNAFFFSSSFYMITRASMKTVENRAVLWNRFLVSLRLAVVMGLTWCFGAIATASQSEVLSYFFNILTALQGVFIFFGFGFGEKTRKALGNKFRRRVMSTSRTQSSSQPGQSVTTV